MLKRWLFWGALGLVLYTYIGFPVLLFVRGRLQRRPVAKSGIAPCVSIIITVHNEAATIGAKLDNVLALDYPRERLEIVIASDGSDDGTNEIVAGYADYGVKLLPFPRLGKIPALNAAVAHTT